MQLTVEQAKIKFAAERGVSEAIDAENLALIAEAEAREAEANQDAEPQAEPAQAPAGKRKA